MVLWKLEITESRSFRSLFAITPRGLRNSTLAIALGTARRVNPFTRRGLLNNRQEAGAVAGRAYLLNYD